MSLSDLQKKLEKESQGIMFPFSAKTPTVDTTQQVYNSATDGIMNMQGKKYVGPDSVIQYTPEGQRQLKEIEKGMLPQFDQEQFPDVGQGRVEDRGGTTPLAIDTTSTYQTQTQTSAFDPCPVGFKFDPQLQRCVAIPQPKSDKQTGPSNPPRNIGPLAKATSSIADAINKLSEDNKFAETYGKDVSFTIDNSTFLSKLGPIGNLIDTFLIKNPADDNLYKLGADPRATGISVSQNKDGTLNVKFTEQGKLEFGQIQTNESLKGNLASTQKTDRQGNIIKAPNGQLMIQGPISLNSFGKIDPEVGFKSSPRYTIKDGEVVYDDPKVDARVKAEREKTKKSPTIPSSAPKAKGTGKEAGFLGFERGEKGTFAQAPSQTGKVKKSKDQIENELDAALSKNNKQTTKSTTKTTSSKSSSSNFSPKRPSFTKTSGGYKRVYTGK